MINIKKKKLYFYIKKRTITSVFNKYYFNENIEKYIDNKYLYLYNYIKNRSLKKDFNNYFYNETYDKIKFNEELPLYLKIKNLIKKGNINEIFNLIGNIEDISGEINSITKKEINKNYINDMIQTKIKDITNIIDSINPVIFFNKNKKTGISGFITNLFGEKDNKENLSSFITNFTIQRTLLDHKIDSLKIIEEKLDKEIQLSLKNKEKLIKFNKKLNNYNNYIELIISYNTDKDIMFDLKKKQETVLELLNILNMTIKSLDINIQNLISYKEIFKKLKVITSNTLNLGVMLFLSSNIKNFNELVSEKNEEFSLYINNIEEIKEIEQKI